MFSILNYLAETVGSDKWSPGVYIFLTLLAIVITIGAMLLMAWRFLKEREKNIQEKKAYVEGVLSKSEINTEINAAISRNTYGRPFGVALVDLDNYSQLNNAFGEKIIKEVINTTVKRFSKNLPFQTQIGRIDDDKFVFLFSLDTEIDEILNYIAGLRTLIKLPIKVTYDTEINITASFSVATFPRHGRSAAKLIESLNIAVYSAKRDGGDRVVVYSEELSEREGDNLQYYEEVKRGIKNNEFILNYQPIVDTLSKEVVGAEGLLRWDNARLGLLNPKDFINILEQSGDIYIMGLIGLERMIEQSNLIKQKAPGVNITLSMNLSPKQLINEKIAVDFQRLLKKYRAQAKDFIIEIEEFLLFDKQENIRNSILKLKELGFKIAVDSFAIDHNTLMKVEKLPIDIIKVNTSVLGDEANQIVKNLTELLFTFAKTHNIKLIGERIETVDQVEYLQSHNVYNCQGYLFSKPVKSEDLIEMILDDEFVNKALERKAYEEEPVEETLVEPVLEEISEAEIEEITSTEVVSDSPANDANVESNDNVDKKDDE